MQCHAPLLCYIYIGRLHAQYSDCFGNRAWLRPGCQLNLTSVLKIEHSFFNMIILYGIFLVVIMSTYKKETLKMIWK